MHNNQASVYDVLAEEVGSQQEVVRMFPVLKERGSRVGDGDEATRKGARAASRRPQTSRRVLGDGGRQVRIRRRIAATSEHCRRRLEREAGEAGQQEAVVGG